MRLKAVSNGKKKVIMSHSEWEAIGKRAQWSKEYNRNVQIFKGTVLLKRLDQEEDPHAEIQSIAGDLLYDAQTTIPTMLPGKDIKYEVDVRSLGEPEIRKKPFTDEQGEYYAYDIFVKAEVTIHVVVPTAEEIKERISRDWIRVIG